MFIDYVLDGRTPFGDFYTKVGTLSYVANPLANVTYTVSNITISLSNTVTVTTADVHNLENGEIFTISDTGIADLDSANSNATYYANVVSSNSFIICTDSSLTELNGNTFTPDSSNTGIVYNPGSVVIQDIGTEYADSGITINDGIKFTAKIIDGTVTVTANNTIFPTTSNVTMKYITRRWKSY